MVFEADCYSVLFVSSLGKTELISGLFPPGSFLPPVEVKSAGEAKRLLMNTEFDIVFINAPLCDESGTELAIDTAENTNSGVILLVRNEMYEHAADKCGEFGVVTLPKPITKQFMVLGINLARAVHDRLKKLEKKNDSLIKKMDEIRIVNRAKWTLITCLSMSENEAHRFIEKQSMDLRITKTEAAKDILSRYEA